MNGVYTSLDEVLDPTRSALLVIDIQNDFVHPQGWSARRSSDAPPLRHVIGPINALISAARDASIPIAYILVQHGPDIDAPNYRARYAARGMSAEDVLCARGTWGALLDAELMPPQAEDIQILRQTYDGFAGTNLHARLLARGAETVVATGVVTELCVRTTAEHAFALGYYTVVAEDATAASSATVQHVTLDGLRRFFGPVLPSRKIIELWKGGRHRTDSLGALVTTPGGPDDGG
jgi:ureidoacrylate peracid hydrolase